MIRTRLGTLLLALGLLVAPALQAQQAQPTEGTRFGLGGGLLVPVGDYGASDKIGANILGIIQIPLANTDLHLRFAGMFGTTAHEVGTGTTNLLGGTADLLYHVGDRAVAARPYVVGGMGLFNVSSGGFSSAKVAFGGGGGLLFGLGNMNAFVEARVMSIRTSGSSLTFLPITLGLMLRS